jgi:hypothetical protein
VLLEHLERVAAPVDPEAFASRLSEAIARDNVSGVYRALFRLVAAPPLLEANAQRVWRTYVDEAMLVVSLRGAGQFEARVRGWSRHHPAVCRILSPMLESLAAPSTGGGRAPVRPGAVGGGSGDSMR